MRSSLKRKSILYVVSEDFYFVTHRLRLASYAGARGAKAYLITNLKTKRETIENAGIRSFNNSLDRGSLKLWKDLFYLLNLLFITLKLKPDIIHNVALKPCLYGSMTAMLIPGAGTVNAIAGLGGALSGNRLTSRLLKSVLTRMFHFLFNGDKQYVIVQNQKDRDFAIINCNIDATRVKLIRGAGVDVDEFCPHPEPPGPIRIAMVCRMLRPKGVAELVETAKLLHKDGHHFIVELVGGPDLDNSQSFSQSELEQFDDLEYVSWSGHSEDVSSVWKRAHIAALPTRYGEGIPKCLIEAASCGRPIVTSDISGCNDIVADRENGILVDPNNIGQLKQALATLIEDKQLRLEYGTKGRERVIRHFSEDRIFDQTTTLYRQLSTPDRTI